MDWADIDWDALARLRQRFLEGSAGTTDYWHDPADLASYDLTFAQRIGWKWEYVLRELDGRGWQPPPGEALDWGCGSGIAGRVFLDRYRAAPVTQLLLSDRSRLALQFAARRVAERFPGLPVTTTDPAGSTTGTLLLSHVLTELDPAAVDALLQRARAAAAVIWVEPGAFEASRQLSRIRDQLRDVFSVVAPCTHRNECPVFALGNESHWCHHFASPPAAVFTDSNWARFAALAGVDLRSLPLSFLVLDKRPLPEQPLNAVRVVGRPRVYKAHAQILACNSEGLRERRLSKRNLPADFRAIKKGVTPPLQRWECDGDEIVRTANFSAHHWH